jgi:glycosyltransferase involved in cell wall biosynthesis
VKVLIVIGAFLPIPPVQGGAVEKLCLAVAKELVKRNHCVTLISKQFPGFPNQEVDEQGIRHIRVKGYATPKSLAILKLLDLFYTIAALPYITKEYDVIVSNTFWLPILVRGKRGQKVVVDVERTPRWQAKLYTHAGYLRANSTPVGNRLRELIPSQFHNKVIEVPNPLPHKVGQVDWQKKEKVVLYVGRIHREKGVELLVKAFGQSMQLSGWKLYIVGPHEVKEGGSGISYLEELKRESQGKEAIQFVGPIYNSEKLQDMYAQSSVFVYPSLAEQGETFGLAPLEAMSYGCVPVVSDLSCFHDFITHEENGYIFNHRGDKNVEQLQMLLEEVCTNNEVRTNIREKALDVNKSHSTEVITQEFLSYFEKL